MLEYMYKQEPCVGVYILIRRHWLFSIYTYVDRVSLNNSRKCYYVSFRIDFVRSVCVSVPLSAFLS